MQDVVSMEQVHGNRVVRVYTEDMGRVKQNCDALISNDSQVTLSVRVADCLPISVIDYKNHAIGLIHAGWRGLEKRIIGKSIKMMSREFNSIPSDLEVKIGPHICQKHYEVSNDFSSRFTWCLGGLSSKGRRTFFDLGKVAELQLVENGVLPENIIFDKRCTFEDKTLFSFRRNKTSKRNIFTLSNSYDPGA